MTATSSFSLTLLSGKRVPPAEIDAIVSARLGPTRGLGNSQVACFNRQVAIYLAHGNGFEGVTTDNNPVMIYRRLQQRREYANGGSGSSFTSQTKYPVSYQWGNLTAQEQVYDPNSNPVGQTVHTLHGSPLDSLIMSGTSCNPWNEGLETQTDYGAPNPLVTVIHYWAQQSGCRNTPQMSSQTTTLDDTNQISKQAFA
jgi:hypothetical protein